MRKLDRRFLPALTLIAAIVGTSGSSLAQSPAVHPPDATPNPAPQTTSTTTKTPPTAEQLGDALMAHQRYQAAIEAYKKAPTSEAAVFAMSATLESFSIS